MGTGRVMDTRGLAVLPDCRAASYWLASLNLATEVHDSQMALRRCSRNVDVQLVELFTAGVSVHVIHHVI